MRNLIAFNPRPTNILLSSFFFSAGDNDIALVNSGTILEQIRNWGRKRYTRIVLLVSSVVPPNASERDSFKEQLRDGLAKLCGLGTQVVWLCLDKPAIRKKLVTDSCANIDGVTVYSGKSMPDAFFSAFPEARESNLLRMAWQDGRLEKDLYDYLLFRTLFAGIFQIQRLETEEIRQGQGLDNDPAPRTDLVSLKKALKSLGEAIKNKLLFKPNESAHKSDKRITFMTLNANELRLFRLVRSFNFPHLAGSSEPLNTLRARLIKVGPKELGVLVLGETGTGKEAVAFNLHILHPERRQHGFVPVNCAGFSGELFKSELFGHVKGAFTGAIEDKKGLVEECEGGTLFLDEIGDLSLSIQAHLLRFLESGEYTLVGSSERKIANVRIIAAGQKSLLNKIDRGEFRSDLYFRLAHVTLETPPLREIAGDLPEIIRHLVYRHLRAESAAEAHAKIGYILEGGLRIFEAYSWPGNTRELNNILRQIIELKEPAWLDLEKKLQPASCIASKETAGERIPLMPLKEYERRYIKLLMEQYPELGPTKLAKRLGISFNTLKAKTSQPSLEEN